MKVTRFTKALMATGCALLVSLAGCANADGAKQQQTKPQQQTKAAEWPRTITVPGSRGAADTELKLEAEPQRIAALDYESAEVAAEFGIAENLVLIPAANLNPALGSHIEELTGVQNFPTAQSLTAEAVLAAEPDLVILSPRHGADDTIGAVLTQAGVPVLQLPSAWTDQESQATGIELIGQATGQEDDAAELIKEISAGHKKEAAKKQTEKQVVVLTNQAGQPFITAGKAYPLELVTLAGAQDAGAKLQLERTSPITAEQLVELNPDGIVLVDMSGTGDKLFAPLLENPAVASLAAVSEGKVLRLQGKQAQALGLTETISGLKALTAWVSTL